MLVVRGKLSYLYTWHSHDIYDIYTHPRSREPIGGLYSGGGMEVCNYKLERVQMTVLLFYPLRLTLKNKTFKEVDR